MTFRWLPFALVFVALAAIGGSTVAYVNHFGWTLYYGDAEAHLDIARRIVDSRNPGYHQIGTVWLPLPHLVTLPLVMNDRLWRSGLAGAIPSSICFVIAGLCLFAAMRRATHSLAAALASLILLIANPNLLYLQATPMTETIVLAPLMALLYFTVSFRETQSLLTVLGAGIACLAASLARYEGWFVIPFVALYFLIAGKTRRRYLAALLFLIVAILGPLYWLAHNWWLYSNPLEFFNGPYSPAAIYRRALVQNMAPYPGDHDWRIAAIYFLTALRMFAGPAAILLGIAGILAAFRTRIVWPIVFAALPPLFYIWSMHSGSTPIFVPTRWPYTYYNTRYALTALPLLAIAGGSLVLLAPLRWRPWIAAAIALIAIIPWAVRPQPDNWITWKESQVNSSERRAWIDSAASFLAANRRPGESVITSFGDLIGIFRAAGIPLRHVLHDGDEPQWPAAVARPDLFLHQDWAVTTAGDPVATAIQRWALKGGPHFHLVKQVKIKYAPVIEIYRR